jgi:Domain of unknown function (DUF4062)
MDPRRIFVSSVIRGFERERAAARAAIESLSMRPVMSEDFGARPYSSEVACLEEVRTSDVYLGIFGARHGYATSAGISVTEAEFNEARRTGRIILCFVQDTERETAQEEFIRRVKLYAEGYLVATFKTAGELTLKIVKALNDHVRQAGVSVLDPPGAKAHADAHKWGSRQPPQYATWFGAVTFPDRQGEEYIPNAQLDRQGFQESLLQPARFGPGMLFRQELGVGTRDGEDYVVFEQPDEQGRRSTSLELHANGTLVYGAAVGGPPPRGYSLVRHYVIDQTEVERALLAFLTYAQWFYGNLERGAVIANVYLAMSLTDITHRTFGRLPAVDLTTMTIPQHQLSDPLFIPRQPLKMSRASLAQPKNVSEEAMGSMVRAFKVANVYYIP